MEKTFMVYIHEFPNGKFYVGITCQEALSRWRNGHGYNRQHKMATAIKFFGWENVRHTIVAENLSKEEAVAIEATLVDKYDSYHNGYNSNQGGYGPSTGANIKLSKKVYRGDGMEYDSIEEAANANGISRSNISRALNGKQLHAGGWSWSFNPPLNFFAKEILATTKAVINTDGEVFSSVKEAARKTGIPESTIRDSLKGRTGVPRKGEWRYIE